MSEDSLEESKTETEPTLSSGLDRVVEKERRDFLVGASAVAAGTLAMLAPIGAAVVSLLCLLYTSPSPRD